jgi:hypothetical protein
MASTPVLALPDVSKQFLVETDVSNFGLGVVLMQSDKPVAFLNKPLSKTHKHLSIYENDFFGTHYGC